MKSYTWMKLLLDPQQATRFDDPALEILARSEGHGVLKLPPDMTAVDLCADFLTEIATFAYSELKRVLGAHVVDISPLEFRFTVPAVWSDRAKADTMRAAAKAARNSKVFRSSEVSTFLIAEPEAAAVATIAHLTQGGSLQQIKVCILEGDAARLFSLTHTARR